MLLYTTIQIIIRTVPTFINMLAQSQKLGKILDPVENLLQKTTEGMNQRGYYHLTCGCLIIVYPSHRILKYCSHYRFSHNIGNYFIYNISRFFIQHLIILSASTGHMWISRWRVLPLLRQYIMHFKSTHRCSVPYFATQACKYVQHNRSRKIPRTFGKIICSIQRIQVWKVQSSRSTASSTD